MYLFEDFEYYVQPGMIPVAIDTAGVLGFMVAIRNGNHHAVIRFYLSKGTWFRQGICREHFPAVSSRMLTTVEAKYADEVLNAIIEAA